MIRDPITKPTLSVVGLSVCQSGFYGYISEAVWGSQLKKIRTKSWPLKTCFFCTVLVQEVLQGMKPIAHLYLLVATSRLRSWVNFGTLAIPTLCVVRKETHFWFIYTFFSAWHWNEKKKYYYFLIQLNFWNVFYTDKNTLGTLVERHALEWNYIYISNIFYKNLVGCYVELFCHTHRRNENNKFSLMSKGSCLFNNRGFVFVWVCLRVVLNESYRSTYEQ